MKKLTGKVALVTGGSRGIGAGIARALAENGADVGISYVASADKAAADIAALNRQLAINYTAVVVAIRAASTLIGEGGRIISIGSGLATRATFPGIADYAATKAAIVGYSKGAARDLAPRKITVNVIQSGSIGTDMNPDEGAFAAAQKSSIALGRFGRSEEVDAGVVFLASPEASYITGTVLNVDGGFGA